MPTLPSCSSVKEPLHESQTIATEAFRDGMREARRSERGMVVRRTTEVEGIERTMTSTNFDELKRTSPLALWRYAHDYLRAAQSLCRQHRLSCTESQAPYHLAAQGLEFALKAYLRAKGASMASLRTEIGRSLATALARAEAQGLPPLPSHSRVAIAEIDACHQDRQFVYLLTPDSTFLDVDPLVEAGVWILDRIAPDVAEHFIRHLADDTSPPTHEFVRRLRADLSATSDVAQPQR